MTGERSSRGPAGSDTALVGGAEVAAVVTELAQYAANRGVAFAPRTIGRHVRKRGRGGMQCYIDKLAAVMDAASIMRIECSQARARQRLARAGEDARLVISGFEASVRRRADRRRVRCRVTVPPRGLRAQANEFAGCGCPRCCERLAALMHNYIAKMLTAKLFSDLDRDDARSEANLELIESIEEWQGGSNFAGWFAARFANRVRATYKARREEERGMRSLDAEWVLADDQRGRRVALREQVPDRSTNVLTIVILLEERLERALAKRRLCLDRIEEFNNGLAEPDCPAPPRPLYLLPSNEALTITTDASSENERRAA
jgi:DNA-directed RNA polymerase specialized sigma24 family protein